MQKNVNEAGQWYKFRGWQQGLKDEADLRAELVAAGTAAVVAAEPNLTPEKPRLVLTGEALWWATAPQAEVDARIEHEFPEMKWGALGHEPWDMRPPWLIWLWPLIFGLIWILV